MSVLAEVSVELERLKVAGWRRETALVLATSVDDDASVAAARELRSLMTELGSNVTISSKGDVSDDLAAQRQARIAKAAG